MEYPREAGREGQYPWVCHHKAVAIADAVIGPRAPAVRQKFNEALMAASVPVSEGGGNRGERQILSDGEVGNYAVQTHGGS